MAAYKYDSQAGHPCAVGAAGTSPRERLGRLPVGGRTDAGVVASVSSVTGALRRQAEIHETLLDHRMYTHLLELPQRVLLGTLSLSGLDFL